MKKILYLVAVCCALALTSVAASAAIQPVKDSVEAARRTVPLQIVHNGSPLRTISSLVVNGTTVPIPAGYAYGTVIQFDPTIPLTVSVTYSDLPGTECFNVYITSLEHQPVLNKNYKGQSTVTFTQPLTASDTDFYLQFLDNIGCNN